jgi:hypothetical protein
MSLFKISTAASVVTAAGVVGSLFGPGLITASAVPSEDGLIEIAKRSVPETCQAVAFLPTPQGVKGAIADIQSQSALPKWAAGRVTGHAVRLYCPQYLRLILQVVPNFP